MRIVFLGIVIGLFMGCKNMDPGSPTNGEGNESTLNITLEFEEVKTALKKGWEPTIQYDSVFILLENEVDTAIFEKIGVHNAGNYGYNLSESYKLPAGTYALKAWLIDTMGRVISEGHDSVDLEAGKIHKFTKYIGTSWHRTEFTFSNIPAVLDSVEILNNGNPYLDSAFSVKSLTLARNYKFVPSEDPYKSGYCMSPPCYTKTFTVTFFGMYSGTYQALYQGTYDLNYQGNPPSIGGQYAEIEFSWIGPGDPANLPALLELSIGFGSVNTSRLTGVFGPSP